MEASSHGLPISEFFVCLFYFGTCNRSENVGLLWDVNAIQHTGFPWQVEDRNVRRKEKNVPQWILGTPWPSPGLLQPPACSPSFLWPDFCSPSHFSQTPPTDRGNLQKVHGKCLLWKKLFVDFKKFFTQINLSANSIFPQTSWSILLQVFLCSLRAKSLQGLLIPWGTTLRPFPVFPYCPSCISHPLPCIRQTRPPCLTKYIPVPCTFMPLFQPPGGFFFFFFPPLMHLTNFYTSFKIPLHCEAFLALHSPHHLALPVQVHVCLPPSLDARLRGGKKMCECFQFVDMEPHNLCGITERRFKWKDK